MTLSNGVSILLYGEGASDICFDQSNNENGLLEMLLQTMISRALELTKTSWLQPIVEQWTVEGLKTHCSLIRSNDLTKNVIRKGGKGRFRKGRTNQDPRLLYFANLSRDLGFKANERQMDFCVFFHDCDELELDAVVMNMQKGFEAVDYRGGIAMVPNPTSEAWILAAWLNTFCCKQKHITQSNAQKFEEQLTHKDRNPRSAKARLAQCYTGDREQMQLKRDDYHRCIQAINHEQGWSKIRCLPSMRLFTESIDRAIRKRVEDAVRP